MQTDAVWALLAQDPQRTAAADTRARTQKVRAAIARALEDAPGADLPPPPRR